MGAKITGRDFASPAYFEGALTCFRAEGFALQRSLGNVGLNTGEPTPAAEDFKGLRIQQWEALFNEYKKALRALRLQELHIKYVVEQLHDMMDGETPPTAKDSRLASLIGVLEEDPNAVAVDFHPWLKELATRWDEGLK